MIIKNISISNEFIHYEHEMMDFCKPGIYLLLGPNGSGKTMLLESIVFDNLDVSFQEPQMKEAYLSQRFSLFAYVQQDLEDFDMSVKDYVLRDNPVTDWREAKELLFELGFEESNFSAKVQTLSGGERIKVSFVSAIVKDVPYIFLDEPTNYLDNSSVEKMIHVIRKLARNKVFVIASHDERLFDLDATRYYVDGKSIKRESRSSVSSSDISNIVFGQKPSYSKIAISKIFRPLNILIWLLVLFVSLCVSFILQYCYFDNYDDESVPPANTISVYCADNAFDTLNQTYCLKSRIEIDESAKHNMIYLDDIPQISGLKGCDDIYILDYPKLNEFICQYAEQKLNDQLVSNESQDIAIELSSFAIPEVLQKDKRFIEVFGMVDFFYLSEGRLPKDGAKEISISKRLLYKYYNFSDSEVQNALGKKIKYENVEYQIVGIQHMDMCIVSYDDSQMNNAFYHYDSSTYPKFKNYYLSYLDKNDFTDKNIEGMVIISQTGLEKSILNQLIKSFPANNYFSSVFIEAWISANNDGFTKYVWLITIFGSVVLSICFLILLNNYSKISVRRLKEYSKYYFTSSIGKWYFVVNLICVLLVLGLDVYFVRMLDHSFGMMRYMIQPNIVSNLILVIPSTVMIWLKSHRIKLKSR